MSFLDKVARTVLLPVYIQEYIITFYCHKFSLQNCTCHEKNGESMFLFVLMKIMSWKKNLLYLYLHR